MNILIVSQYFWPESFIINDLVLKIKEQGHSVTVYTGKPNYPDGEIYPGYNNTGTEQEFYDKDIPVFRVPLRPRKNGGAKNLARNYFSFVYSGLRHAFRFSKNKKFDAIVVFLISPATAAIPAIFLKWLTKSHLTLWIQDIWPESLQATGFVNNRFLLKCVKIMVRGIYFFSDSLLVQSRAFIPKVSSLAPHKEIIYYPNSAMDYQDNEDKHLSLPTELDLILKSHFCIVFAGNLGSAQGIDTIIKAAICLKKMTNIKVLLVGSGSQSDWIKEQIAKNRLDNLILTGRFPSTFMPAIFSKASALLVTLKKSEIFTYTIPSKIQSYLASGKPIIASIDGEGARIIKEAEAGYCSPAENEVELAENIIRLYNLSDSDRDHLGKSARAYYLENFEMSTQSKRLIEILENKIIGGRTSG